jgi:hypothetical protein
MIISPDTFHCREALSCRLWVCGKMAGKHFPDDVRDAPLFLGGESLEGFILPVFKQNVSLMHIFPLKGRVSQESPGTPEYQAGIELAVFIALTIVTQGGGPNKGMQATAYSRA